MTPTRKRQKSNSLGGIQQVWHRSNKRLSRDSGDINKVVAGCDKKGLIIVKIDHNESPDFNYHTIVERLITQRHVKKRVIYHTKVNQPSHLARMPKDVLMMILNYLSSSDIQTLTNTCKLFAEFVNWNYIESIVLPLSSKNLKKLNGRYVLSLESSIDIIHLNLLKDGEYMRTNVEPLNITKLRRLIFVLYKYGLYSNFPQDHILPPLYKTALNYFLSEAKCLTYLRFSVDRSEESFKMVEIISKNLPFLEEVVIQTTNTFDRTILPIEHPGSLKKDQCLVLDSNSLTLNQLLAKLLENQSIKTLKIKGLYLCQDWGKQDNNLYYNLEIESKNLTTLKIEQDGCCRISKINCEELLYFKFVDIAEYEELTCLLHQHAFDGGVGVLANGCPKLEKVNKIDIKSLKEYCDDSPEDWIYELASVCPCEESEEGELEEYEQL